MQSDRQHQEFLDESGRRRSSIVAEFWGFLRESKKWWLLPILVVLLIFGALILLSGTAVAPFIYTLF
jgi:hypothetical protein